MDLVSGSSPTKLYLSSVKSGGQNILEDSVAVCMALF